MKKGATAVEQIDFNRLRRELQMLMEEVDRRLTSEHKAHLQVEIPKLEEDVNGGEEMVANPKPDMMMLNRDLVVRLAEQHRLAITIRPDGSIFGLSQHLDRLRTLVKDELARAATKRAGGRA